MTLAIVTELFDRADETPLASPYLQTMTGDAFSKPANLTGGRAVPTGAAGGGSEHIQMVKTDVTSAWNCSAEVTLGPINTANLFWQVGVLMHAARDPSLGVGAVTANNMNYHYAAIEWDNLNRVSGYMGVGGFVFGSGSTSWQSTSAVAWVIAAGDVLRFEVSRDGLNRDTWTFKIRHSADAAFTTIGSFQLTANETDTYVPYTAAGRPGIFFTQYKTNADVSIESWVFNDETLSATPADVTELTTGAWSKLMREMRLGGLDAPPSGNRGDGTESWRTGAFD